DCGRIGDYRLNPAASSSMNSSPSIPAVTRFPSAWRRAFVLLALAAGLALIAAFSDLHEWLVGFLPYAEALIRERPIAGVSVFVLFAALSAMLAFVSSAVLVPVGVYVWGKAGCALLLWLGWILGGVSAYSLSRYFGRPLVRRLHGEGLERYEKHIAPTMPFKLVLLLQAAMPSEVPGYLLGLAGYRFWKYVAALALIELPYSVATTYLGASFLERRMFLLIGGGIGLAVFTAWAFGVLQRKFRNSEAH
ncbi:MAG: TVP38/TMEM64 family protein, partial [Candidatus Korobacteraceae bacterium]